MNPGKMIMYTQRVERIDSYGERRDCCDQRMPMFLRVCGYLPVPVMNVPSIAVELASRMDVGGIVFTGGNSLAKYGGDAPERDETEHGLIELSLEKRIPLLGICRGMQTILDYFGIPLEPVENHIGIMHEVQGKIHREQVNSYHGQGTRKVRHPLLVWGRSLDGVVEAVRHENLEIMGIMWHPEREPAFNRQDVDLAKQFFR